MAEKVDLFIGFDLGGTFLKYALGNSRGEILFKSKKPSKGDQSKDAIFSVFYECIKELLVKAKKQGGTVVAIGVGSPGAINFDKGKLLGNTPNLPQWGNAQIRKRLEGKYGIPVWVDNDANLMALAESRVGAAKGYENVIALTLGTGIGGGILINNELYRGHNFAGAELGHMSIAYDGIPCDCGGRGCIERYASATAMVKNYIARLSAKSCEIPDKVTTELIFTRAHKGDREAIETIDETAEYLGAALASLTNIFNEEIIVIGGGVAEAGDEFMNLIWQAVQSRTMKPGLLGLKLVRAKLGNDAGMYGAVSLAIDNYYKTENV
ncbi:MAG: ROK family protein [Calditrichaeota bacterium]|nr:ROK family protein [Calditrichota bacterium]